MVFVLVHHTWDQSKDKDAQKFFDTVKAAASGGKLPKGFQLQYTYIGKGEAYCIWSVPSSKELMDVASSLKPPTKIDAKELTKFS
ncbi:MAG: hypothetical protein ACP5UI_00460 [Thermoprotei archaeon]|nr:hypothetical protein [TACK group archaeon]